MYPLPKRSSSNCCKRRVEWRGRSTLVFACTVAIFGCQRAPHEAPAAAARDEKTEATPAVISPERASINRDVSNPASIESFEETPIFAKIAGYVKPGWRDRGDILHKGEILAELWVPEREVDLRHKEALLRQAESEIKQARQAVTVAAATYKSAEAKVAESEAKLQASQARYNRMKSQYDRMAQMHQVVNKENIEEAQLGFLTARANLAEAEAAVKFAQASQLESKARWDKAETDFKVAEDRRDVAREERDYAHTMLEYARIPAPYDCVVTQRHVVTGDFVQTATNGQSEPLYVVHRTDRMRVLVPVPERESTWVQKGVAARIRVQALGGKTFVNRVSRIAWSVDGDTRTMRAEIDLPNQDGQLRPGMYAYVTLDTKVPDLLTLPLSAVATEGDVTRGYETYCCELRDGKPYRLRIETGVRDNRRVQILRKQIRNRGSNGSARWEDFSGSEIILRNFDRDAPLN
jgi:HlyD family secretion protein